jgi:hypothetical protein
LIASKAKKLHLALFFLNFPLLVVYNTHFMFDAAREYFVRIGIRRTDVEDSRY